MSACVGCVLLGGDTYEIDGILFEWHPRLGPATVSKTGEILDKQPGPRHRFWKVVALWNEQGRRLDTHGACVYEVSPEPQYVQLAGRNYAEVPLGLTPEEVRDAWFRKLGLSDRV